MMARVARLFVCTSVLVCTLNMIGPDTASAIPHMRYAIQAYYANRSIATGVTSQVYTYAQNLAPTGGTQVESIYMWASGGEYIEVAYRTDYFAEANSRRSDLLVAFESVGRTLPGMQEVKYFEKPMLDTWYNFQIYSNDGTRYWKAGKNNSVHWEGWMNTSCGKAIASAERESYLDTNRVSYHNMHYREYMKAWTLWSSTYWEDVDPMYWPVVRSTSSWYSMPL